MLFKLDSMRISRLNLVIIILCLVFNPYIIDLLRFDAQDTLQQISWMIYLGLLNNYKSYQIGYFSIGVSMFLNPSNGLFAIIGLIQISQRRILKYIAITLGISCIFCYFYIFSQQKLVDYYEALYFPQIYKPQFNLLWILYAHMFQRYLLLYQIVFIILQTNSLYLVTHLNLTFQLKILIIMYFKLYCNYKCSQLSIICAILSSFLILFGYINQNINKWTQLQKIHEVIKLKIITLITVIANIALFALYKILLNKYLNDFSINIGYLFLFLGLYWAFNSVYLAELVINWTQLTQKTLLIKNQNSQKLQNDVDKKNSNI